LQQRIYLPTAEVVRKGSKAIITEHLSDDGEITIYTQSPILLCALIIIYTHSPV
jgi:hypothetical protein